MKNSSCNEAVSGSTENEDRGQRGRKPEREAHGRHVLEAQPAGEEAPEDRAERPEGGRRQRVEGRRASVQRDVERARERHQPRPDQAAEQEQSEARARTLAEDRRGQRHGDQRLNLLQDDRRHRIALHERLREQDRRERRRSRADDDPRGDVARAGAPEGRKGGHDDGEEDEDEEDVLAQDDRRRLGRLRERAPEQRVGSPQSRRDSDGGDSDTRAAHRSHHATVCLSSVAS